MKGMFALGLLISANAGCGSGSGGLQDGSVDAGYDGGDTQCLGKNDFTPCVLPGAQYKYNICLAEACRMPGCGDLSCNPPGPNFKLPPTINPGVNYTKTVPAAGQPVVSDSVTGLVWQGCVAGLSGDSCDLGAAATMNWKDALAYCNSLDWGGFKDWRLPNRDELISIVDFGVKNPSIDTTNFPKVITDKFWTLSTYQLDVGLRAWYVEFANGEARGELKDNMYYARCARGGPGPIQAMALAVLTPRFSRSFPGPADQPMVKDNVTGLVWQGCIAGLSGSDCGTGTALAQQWTGTKSYCENLDWSGASTGWRLPEVKELASITDSSRSYPMALDMTVFPNTHGWYTWTITPAIYGTLNKWTVSMYFGDVEYHSFQMTNYNFRCVRSGS